MALDTVTIRRPFDTHVHGRQGDLLRTVAPATARQFWGAIFEPNLNTPITTAKLAREYRQEIVDAVGDDSFSPYVLAYFTDTIDPEELSDGLSEGDIFGLKFYPKGATTNSESGVTDISTLWTRGTRQFQTVRAVQANDSVVQLHCELNFTLKGDELDPYDKEDYFFDEIMPRLQDAHPDTKWSCEHLTSKQGVQYLRKNGGPKLGCSITPHHLLFDRRDMFRGGLRPHLFCLPVIKRSEDMDALVMLATSGLSFVYAGTDSAPHDRRKKECDCCSGGVFSAHAAVEFYAMAFDLADAMDELEGFMSVHGPHFYKLPPSDDVIHIRREPWKVEEIMSYSDNEADTLWPLGYDKNPKLQILIPWKMME